MKAPASPIRLFPRTWRRIKENESSIEGDKTLCFSDENGKQCEPYWDDVRNFRAPWGDELVIRHRSVKQVVEAKPLRSGVGSSTGDLSDSDSQDEGGAA